MELSSDRILKAFDPPKLNMESEHDDFQVQNLLFKWGVYASDSTFFQMLFLAGCIVLEGVFELKHWSLIQLDLQALPFVLFT